MAEVDRMHLRLLPASRSQGRVAAYSRTLAGRKLEALSDAVHELREGEGVRECTQTIQVRVGSVCGFARRLTTRRKTVSGFARRAFTGTVTQDPRFAGQTTTVSVRSRRRAHRSTKEVGRACLQATIETVRGGHVPTKAARGPRRSEGCPHPRRSKGVGERCVGRVYRRSWRG